MWQLCASMMSWVRRWNELVVTCLLKDSKLFILFAKNSQILLKISVMPILVTLIFLVALNLLVNNQLNSSFNSSLRHIIVTKFFTQSWRILEPSTYQAMQPVFMASIWARVTTDLLPEAVITMSTFLITASNLTTWEIGKVGYLGIEI